MEQSISGYCRIYSKEIEIRDYTSNKFISINSFKCPGKEQHKHDISGACHCIGNSFCNVFIEINEKLLKNSHLKQLKSSDLLHSLLEEIDNRDIPIRELSPEKDDYRPHSHIWAEKC